MVSGGASAEIKTRLEHALVWVICGRRMMMMMMMMAMMILMMSESQSIKPSAKIATCAIIVNISAETLAHL